MAAILIEDPTLLAADRALEEAENKQKTRTYVGMSNAGACMRQNYYRFYMAGWGYHAHKTLKMFADGHRSEALTIDRLRLVEGLTIIDRDPDTGGQLECVDFDGHYKGHLDFEVLGLLQAPKTWHVGEVKCVGENEFRKFKKLKENNNEKLVLKQWRETYYAQAQQYMMYRGRKRHYMVVTSAGGREWDSVRTDFNKEDAQLYAGRARSIIEHPDKMPDRISENGTFYICKYMCEFTGICHDGEAPARNCRTCVWSEPIANAGFRCIKHEKRLTPRDQREGCADQRYRPALLNAEVQSVDDQKNEITYRVGDGYWIDKGCAEDGSV